MDPVFALIHSPLVGPLTWSLVANQLRQRGLQALVPALADVEGAPIPYWQQHATSLAPALASMPADHPVILVAHSGSGPLLPPIRQAAGRSAAAYLFVDAGLPHPGQSRLDEMQANSPEFAEQLRQHLAAGRRYPEWTDDDLREEVPDDRLRHALLAELHPRPLAFFEEPMPIVPGWPDAPCAYLQLSSAYQKPAEAAARQGWPTRVFDAGHFHMLVAPAAVADVLVELTASS